MEYSVRIIFVSTDVPARGHRSWTEVIAVADALSDFRIERDQADVERRRATVLVQ